MNEENLGGLFDMDPVVFKVGDEVVARTVWGDESGTVVAIEELADGFKVATVATDRKRGAVRVDVQVSLTRLTKRESPH